MIIVKTLLGRDKATFTYSQYFSAIL